MKSVVKAAECRMLEIRFVVVTLGCRVLDVADTDEEVVDDLKMANDDNVVAFEGIAGLDVVNASG